MRKDLIFLFPLVQLRIVLLIFPVHQLLIFFIDAACWDRNKQLFLEREKMELFSSKNLVNLHSFDEKGNSTESLLWLFDGCLSVFIYLQ
jgi:hypothetical protein